MLKEIVAYSTKGIPLTKEAFIKEIEEGEKEVKAGRTMTTKELKKRIKTWKKG